MTDDVRAAFEQLLAGIRPKLHRYCTRMTGSAVDGEDIVQDAMMKALDALPEVGILHNAEGWLFRIAHNTALDFLRRHAREPAACAEDDLLIAADESAEHADDIAATTLRMFLRLPASQRSAVILKDVLGHSIEELSSITGVTPAAAKSALQRGRARLRQLANEPDNVDEPQLTDEMRLRLAAYVDGFRTGDFDAVRRMLADEVKLDLVGIFAVQDKHKIGQYYSRYAEAAARWAYGAGIVDGRPAMLVFEREISLETPAYFVALTFDGEYVTAIHDFLFARYAMESCTLQSLAM